MCPHCTKAAHQPIVNSLRCMQRPFSKFERARRVAALIWEGVSMHDCSANHAPDVALDKLAFALGRVPIYPCHRVLGSATPGYETPPTSLKDKTQDALSKRYRRGYSPSCDGIWTRLVESVILGVGATKRLARPFLVTPATKIGWSLSCSRGGYQDHSRNRLRG